MNPVWGHCLAGSLSGADAWQKITQVPKGSLTPDGNRSASVKAKESLTVRQTCRTGAKAGLNDPAYRRGMEAAYRITVTPGITEWSRPIARIAGAVRYLDVGSSHPGAVAGPKGWSVRPLKRHASWVQTVVRQVGLYPVWA